MKTTFLYLLSNSFKKINLLPNDNHITDLIRSFIIAQNHIITFRTFWTQLLVPIIDLFCYAYTIQNSVTLNWMLISGPYMYIALSYYYFYAFFTGFKCLYLIFIQNLPYQRITNGIVQITPHNYIWYRTLLQFLTRQFYQMVG